MCCSHIKFISVILSCFGLGQNIAFHNSDKTSQYETPVNYAHESNRTIRTTVSVCVDSQRTRVYLSSLVSPRANRWPPRSRCRGLKSASLPTRSCRRPSFPKGERKRYRTQKSLCWSSLEVCLHTEYYCARVVIQAESWLRSHHVHYYGVRAFCTIFAQLS